jgi:hypothetical protein
LYEGSIDWDGALSPVGWPCWWASQGVHQYKLDGVNVWAALYLDTDRCVWVFTLDAWIDTFSYYVEVWHGEKTTGRTPAGVYLRTATSGPVPGAAGDNCAAGPDSLVMELTS